MQNILARQKMLHHSYSECQRVKEAGSLFLFSSISSRVGDCGGVSRCAGVHHVLVGVLLLSLPPSHNHW